MIMKINQISSLWSANNVYNKRNYVQNPIVNNNIGNDVFVKSSEPAISHKTVSFRGYDVHIVDGGKHADDMEHFAGSVSNKMEIHMHRMENTKESGLNKPLRNVEAQLQQINRYKLTDENSYVAIPVKITVPLQNLQEQYKQVMGYYLHLQPHSTKTCKKKIMEFLRVLYENPEKYKKYIRYMDPQNQGIEYAYGIINEIDNLKCRKVYVPSEHPQEETLNWLAGERGEKPELTNYLATGYDKDNKVHNMLDYIKGEGWYNFNLLTLSRADVVNLKKLDGETDHIYSAYDTTVNKGARGVYNLTPIRENGKVTGYSFKDTFSNDYPYDEFPHNDEIKDIIKFVGQNESDVVANDDETARFKEALRQNKDMLEFANKLYPVWKVFDEKELNEGKIFDKGDFVDYKLENYFRRNGDYKIIYPEADCESSGRPSVMGMWGSCYSMFTAIAKDIDARYIRDSLKTQNNINLNSAIYGMLNDAQNCESKKDWQNAAKILTEVTEYIDMEGFDRRKSDYLNTYRRLADAKFNSGDYLAANGLYNFYLNNLCKNFVEDLKEDDYKDAYQDRIHIAKVFERLAEVAQKRGEYYPEKECRRAAFEVISCTQLGNEVLERRANDDINIGDIFG